MEPCNGGTAWLGISSPGPVQHSIEEKAKATRTWTVMNARDCTQLLSGVEKQGG